MSLLSSLFKQWLRFFQSVYFQSLIIIAIACTSVASPALAVDTVRVGNTLNNSTGSYDLDLSNLTGFAMSYTVREYKNNVLFHTYTNILPTVDVLNLTGKDSGVWRYEVSSYYFSIDFNSGGYSEYWEPLGSATVNVAKTPGMPASITPSTMLSTNGSVTINWGVSSGTVSAYQLEQYAYANGSWNPIHSGIATNKSVTGLNNGTYQYRVRACNTVNGYTSCSGWRYSPDVTVLKIPGVPGAISAPATDADGTFSLSWGAASGTVSSYRLEQKINSGAWSQIQSSTARTASISVSGSGTYYYRVRACNTSGCSGYTANAPVNVSIPLAPPSTPTWHSSSDSDSDFGDYNLVWNAAPGSVSYYQLQERVNAGSWANITLLDSLSYDARGKVAGDYHYQVRACNQDACSGWRSRNVKVHNLQGVAPAVTITAADVPGTSPYTADVSSQGSAQITLPIRTVPGINGAEPNLALFYTSGRARQRLNDSLPEDILGYGWQVSGFSEIRRCVKGRSDVTEVLLTNTDSLCLDGEPMVLVSGTHLQPNAQYRVLRDNFTKVVMQGTAAEGWFKVYLPDGTIHELGSAPASRVRVKDSKGTSPYFLWSIHKSTDPFGNTITYQYHKDEVSGINYPLSIQYGQNNDATITFRYARRDDAVPIQLANIQPEQLVLLHTIDLELSGTKVREYRLASEVASEGWRRLDQVQECGYDAFGTTAQCLNPLNVNWLTDPNTEYKTAINQMTDGLGAVTQFEYVKMTNSGTVGQFSERPFGNGILPIEAKLLEANADGTFKSVVTALRKSNGLGGMHHTTYAYQGQGLVNAKNWGFLGFYAQRIIDTASGVVTYKQFRLDEPHFAQVSAIHQYDNVYGLHTETLSKVANRYAEQLLTHGNNKTTGYPFLSDTVQYQYDNNVLLGVKKVQVSHVFANNLLSQSTETTTFAHGANASGGGAFWGDLPSHTLSGVQRTVQRETAYQNRTSSQWLVGFVTGLEERYYQGALGSNLDRTKTLAFTPHGSSNKVATTVTFPGDPSLELTESRTYTGSGLLSSVTQVGQNVAARTVVSNSNFVEGRYPTLQSNAANQHYHQSYDRRFGVPNQVTDPNGRISSMALNGFGQEVSRTTPDGVTQTTHYESCDLVLCSMVGPISPIYRVRAQSGISPDTIQYYDRLGRVIRSAMQGFDGISYLYQDIHYDALGRVDRYSQPYFAGDTAYFVQNGYDIRNRLEAQILPSGGSKTMDYVPNASTHQVAVTVNEDIYDSAGTFKEVQTKTSKYNMLGELVQLTEAAGTSAVHTVSYAYTADGLLKESIAGGNTTSVVYDHAGNRISLNDPSFGTITSHYTALGQLRQTTDNKNQTTTYHYDVLGRKTQAIHADGTALWTYDPANALGALASRSYGSEHAETYTYNSASKLVGIQTAININGFSRTYHQSLTYDGYGRVATASLPSGLTVEQTYNSRGYLTGLRNAANDEALVTYQAMNAYGQVTTQQLGNGISQTRSYDQRTGTINGIQSVRGSNVLQNNTYGWQSNGILDYRAANDAGTVKEELFAYDAHNRLTASITTVDDVIERELTTAYAPNGNILSKLSSVATDPESTSYSYGGTANTSAYAVSAVTIKGIQNTLHYDANGSITQYNAATGDDRFISWSARNLPTNITLGASVNDAAPTARDELAYDADGGRYYKKSTWRDGQGIQQTEHTFYVGEFEEIVSSNDSDYLGIKKSRVGDSILHVAATLNNSLVETSIEYLLRDHLGSVEKVTDESGNILMTQAFDPFGERRSPTWLSAITDAETETLLASLDIGTSRGYTGHEHLSRTGLIHMNGRIYDAQLGRFLSPDPIVIPESGQSWNRYSYVMNNPNSLIDPTGYIPEMFVYGTPIYGWDFFMDSFIFNSINFYMPSMHIPDVGQFTNLDIKPDAKDTAEAKRREKASYSEEVMVVAQANKGENLSYWDDFIRSARNNLTLQFEAQGAFGTGGKIAGEITGNGDKSLVAATTKGYGYDVSARLAGSPLKSENPVRGAFTAFSISAGAPVSVSFTLAIDANKNWDLTTAVGTGASLFIGTELGYRYSN